MLLKLKTNPVPIAKPILSTPPARLFTKSISIAEVPQAIKANKDGIEFTIGREGHIKLDPSLTTISGIQARITKIDNFYKVLDGEKAKQGSTNGTFCEVVGADGKKRWVKIDSENPILLPAGTRIRFSRNDDYIIKLP